MDYIKILALNLKEYILVIKDEFREFIPKDRMDFLDKILDYEELITIEDTGTISCFVRGNKIYLPILAERVIKKLSFNSDFGSIPDHKVYERDTLIINNNTFNSYIEHAVLAGISVLDFYCDMLLHEALHLCGMDGANAFFEGVTELKTRELAYKYNFKTNGCGYFKEIKIVNRFQKIFGSNLINKIAFIKDNNKKYEIIKNELGERDANLFWRVINLMNKEFQSKYYKNNFSSDNAPYDKALIYDTIDYSDVNKIIDDYFS